MNQDPVFIVVDVPTLQRGNAALDAPASSVRAPLERQAIAFPRCSMGTIPNVSNLPPDWV